MGIAQRYGAGAPAVTGGTGHVTSGKQENRPIAKPVAMVTVTQAEHDKVVVAEVEKLRGEIAELKEIIMSLPWFSASAPTDEAQRPPSKRDRATYMREYRKRRKADGTTV